MVGVISIDFEDKKVTGHHSQLAYVRSTLVELIYSNCFWDPPGARCSSVVERPLMMLWDRSLSDRSLMVDSLNNFWFQQVLHDWYNKAMVCAVFSVGWYM